MQLKKNDILEVFEGIDGLGPVTDGWLREWQEHYEGNMIDDAGEIRLTPREIWYDIAPGSKLIVTRARIAHGMVGVVNPETGTPMRVYRDRIEECTRVLK